MSTLGPHFIGHIVSSNELLNNIVRHSRSSTNEEHCRAALAAMFPAVGWTSTELDLAARMDAESEPREVLTP